MPLPRSARLLKKAESALLAAIEIYNKPDFKYREETFSILMLNAWELLLKAKLMHENRNDQRCLLVYESRQTRTGAQTRKQFIRRNRTGNTYTKSLGQVIIALDGQATTRVPVLVKQNLAALTEIRDNAAHYFNIAPDLSKQVPEIGTASVSNFLELSRRWFALDLSAYQLYLLPMGFVRTPTTVTAIGSSPDEMRLIRYLAGLIRAAPAEEGPSDFHLALEVDIALKRSAGAVTGVTLTKDPGAVGVKLTEADIRQTWRWDYKDLCERLRS